MKKQHFDIIVGKLRSSFIDAGYEGLRGSRRGKMGAGICHFRGWEMGFCALGTGFMKEKQ